MHVSQVGRPVITSVIGNTDEMSINFSHPSLPVGKVEGFTALWAFDVHGFDPARHCQACFKGTLAKNFNSKNALSGVDVVLERAPSSRFVYVCGVAAGPKSLKGERNLHLPLRYAPGRVVERSTYNGYRVRVMNAEELKIPDLPDHWNGLPTAHHRCKNFQFGVAYLL